MIYLFLDSVFDGDGDHDECTIVTTRAFARALQDGFSVESISWDVAPGEAQQEVIESGIAAVTSALNE